MLEVRDLKGTRSDLELFRDLSFQALPGEVVYVRGSNGAGKTTLLRMLCGLIRPDEGTVFWGGVSLTDCEAEFHRALAYVGHDNGIKGDLTPVENLKFFHQVNSTDPRVSLTQALDRLGIASLAHIPCRYLSAGQKRRVALARLVISNARLWLLDEPFTGLDETARQMVSGLVAEHLTSEGLCIATSHQPVDFDRFRTNEIHLGTLS
ncbi:MAG: cytochrome c biogenesis heme-transporting ATPase CcmA [Acidiferrobacterales bacterium]|nr:cytochrome c biogenesis heme-transporting ATPase CcmA [Acidiferrobacterales bacterium]